MNINSLYKLCEGYYRVAIRRERLNKEEFNRLRTVRERMDYLGGVGFRYIAEGSSRAVYRINDRKVLKVALNMAGVAQNQVEFFNLRKNPEIFPKVYDKAPDDSWIEVEYVRVFDYFSEVEAAFGMVVGSLRYCLDFANSEEEMVRHSEDIAEMSTYGGEGARKVWWNQFINNVELMKIVRGIQELNLPMSEFNRIGEHWGRAGDGRVVIVDAGFSKVVNERLYRDQPSREDNFNYPLEPEVIDEGVKGEYITRDPKNYLPDINEVD